ncbi:MAG: sensor histidine kinase, partial [Planctomycetota bacterium]
LYLLCPAASVERAKREARQPVLLVSGLGLLAAVLLGAVLARTVTRPLRRLADRAAWVREGRLDVAIPRGGGREVEALARAFERMLEGLARYREELVKREKMATLGRFSAAVAHEIRNPLSSLRMTVEMLRRDAGEETAADLDFLLSEMARLDHSVEELLFHAGTPRYELADVDLRVALEETVRSLSPLADHLGVGLDAETPAEAVPARADLGKVRQALTNLVLNALQASGPESRVAVRLRVEGGKAVLEVADGGDGVPQEIAERVFEPFVTGRGGGTGLGLAVTRAIAAAHAGDVAFAREGETTLFTLRLPLGEG